MIHVGAMVTTDFTRDDAAQDFHAGGIADPSIRGNLMGSVATWRQTLHLPTLTVEMPRRGST